MSYHAQESLAYVFCLHLNKFSKARYTVQPYLKHNIGDFSLYISVQKLQFPLLGKKFAISAEDSAKSSGEFGYRSNMCRKKCHLKTVANRHILIVFATLTSRIQLSARIDTRD